MIGAAAQSPFRRQGSTLFLDGVPGPFSLTVCRPGLVRVRLDPAGHVGAPSYVAVAPDAWPAVPFETPGGAVPLLETGACRIRIVRQPLALIFEDAGGAPLLRAPIDRGVTRETMVRNAAGSTADRSSPRQRLTARFSWEGEQHFYGLGEGGQGLERLDSVRQLWNSHFVHGPGSDIGVPLLLSSRGYGLFFDNTADAQLVVGRSDGGNALLYRAENGPLDLYFLYGGDLRGVLAEVRELLGPPLLPPRWALGYLQSTRHFEDAAELERLPRDLRERRIPCDAIILLSSYGDARGWNGAVGHLEWQPELVPRPARLLADLGARGFRLITHEYPVLHPQSPLFEEAQRLGYLLDEGYERIEPATRPTTNFHEGQRYIDFSNPAARAWWWERHRALVDLGVDGWWLDGGEGPSAAARLHGGEGLTLHNLYDRLRQEGFAAGEARDRPEQRPFLLCRSGAAGMQRFGATCWSGDINNTFATLEAQIPLGLNTGLSGIPFWGTDIGGFFHPQPESGELFARWFQFGAFCAGFRAHGTIWREHLPWAHGPEVEAICRRYAELRYRLLPYTYTLAWQAHRLGLPPMRPLVLNYPGDPAVWELGSEYLWGDDLLVAPVTRQGATAWPVYLPAGGWYDYWTARCYQGPAGVTVEAPLERLPLFVRAGAILPQAPPAQHDGERAWDELTLLIYPSGASRFELYEDDGRTNAYRAGHYALTPITCLAEEGQVTVEIGPPQGDADLLPPGRSYTLELYGPHPRRVVLDGEVLSERAADDQSGPGYWRGDGHLTTIRLHRSRARLIVER